MWTRESYKCGKISNNRFIFTKMRNNIVNVMLFDANTTDRILIWLSIFFSKIISYNVKRKMRSPSYWSCHAKTPQRSASVFPLPVGLSRRQFCSLLHPWMSCTKNFQHEWQSNVITLPMWLITDNYDSYTVDHCYLTRIRLGRKFDIGSSNHDIMLYCNLWQSFFLGTGACRIIVVI